MAQIRDMAELLGTDIEYVYPGRTYVFPSDLDVESTYRLIPLIQRMGDEPGTLEEQKQFDIEIREALLECFQVRDPTIENLDEFGVRALRMVLTDAINALGLVIEEASTSPPPKATPKRATSLKTSTRSRGSRSS